MRMDAGEADGDGHTKRERERTGAMVLGSSAAGACSAHVDEVFMGFIECYPDGSSSSFSSHTRTGVAQRIAR